MPRGRARPCTWAMSAEDSRRLAHKPTVVARTWPHDGSTGASGDMYGTAAGPAGTAVARPAPSPDDASGVRAGIRGPARPAAAAAFLRWPSAATDGAASAGLCAVQAGSHHAVSQAGSHQSSSRPASTARPAGATAPGRAVTVGPPPRPSSSMLFPVAGAVRNSEQQTTQAPALSTGIIGCIPGATVRSGPHRGTEGRREETTPHSTEPMTVADRQIGENLASGSRPASTAGRVNRRRAEGGGGPAERAGRGAIQSPRDAYVTC